MATFAKWTKEIIQFHRLDGRYSSIGYLKLLHRRLSMRPKYLQVAVEIGIWFGKVVPDDGQVAGGQAVVELFGPRVQQLLSH